MLALNLWTLTGTSIQRDFHDLVVIVIHTRESKCTLNKKLLHDFVECFNYQNRTRGSVVFIYINWM